MKAFKTTVFALTAIVASTSTSTAFAEVSATAAAAAPQVGSTLGLVALGIGIMMGLAVLGGTLGQSKAAATALDGIARNPAASKLFTTPLILALALMESLVLFAFVIGFFLQGYVGAAFNVLK